MAIYQKQIRRAYIIRVRHRDLFIGDLVLKVARHVQEGLSALKLAPKWKGPHIREAYGSYGSYHLIPDLILKVVWHPLM